MGSKADKSPNAFRTISEVADSMGVPQHVLRFWESKFSQINPMKRGGGRRYYRPEDMEIIEAIRKLLHEDGYTIKGAQKYMKEQGVKNILQEYNGQTSSDKQKEAEPFDATEILEKNYNTQILTITEKAKQIAKADAEMVSTLKHLRSRLEKIRLHLKAASR